MDIGDWPHEFKEKLIIGTRTNNVGIATLWSEKEKIAEHLDPNTFCVVANFYDVYNGLEPMLRNCLSNPYIRYIIVIGNDKSKSKDTLTNFFFNGFENGYVNNTDVTITKDIPDEYLELVRLNIKLIDLTDQIEDLSDFEHMAKIVNLELEKINVQGQLDPYMEPMIFPKTPQKIDVFPSDNTVFSIKDDFVGKVWLRILNTINSYGINTQTTPDESSQIRECINIISVINKEDPDDPRMFEYFRFSKDDIFRYYKEFCTNYVPDGTSYTYGSRFHSYNQIEIIKDKIRENKYSKRCFMTTWNVKDLDNSTPPCVISFQVNIQNDKLYATSYIRSNDMFRAYPLNAFGLRKMQKLICEDLGFEMAPLTIISHSAHIYKENLDQTKSILEKFYGNTNCFYDPRGYYIINQVDDKIKVKHMTPNSKLLKEYEGSTAREINDMINSSQHPTDPYHSSYLGEELMKAEIAIKLKIEYVQDQDLDI